MIYLLAVGVLLGKLDLSMRISMNDHAAPDPNAFSVFSDELWEEIMDTADENNKIDYYDISDASYYAWQCQIVIA